MKLKEFYRRVREVESGIEEAFPLIASLPTSDGGRPGVITEETRAVAARFIAEGRSRLATANAVRVGSSSTPLGRIIAAR